MDQIKEVISNRIQKMVLDTNWNNFPDVEPLQDRQNIASKVSPLITMIIIPSLAGPRFFEVIVKERY